MTLEETTLSGNKNKTCEKKPGEKSSESSSEDRRSAGKSSRSKTSGEKMAEDRAEAISAGKVHEGTMAAGKASESQTSDEMTGRDREDETSGDEIPEGRFTRAIEKVTARAPSQIWMLLAGAGVAGSLALFLTGRRRAGLLAGLAPLGFLAIGNHDRIKSSIEARRTSR